MANRTWKFKVDHSLTRQQSFQAAQARLREFLKSSVFSVEVGPLAPDVPNMLKIKAMGYRILAAIGFHDGFTLVGITAPESAAWAEPIVRKALEAQISELYAQAGSSAVEITQLE